MVTNNVLYSESQTALLRKENVRNGEFIENNSTGYTSERGHSKQL